MFKIPSTERVFSQPNTSDVNGNIFATKNINFDEEGYLKLSHGFVKMSSSDADFDEVDSMFKSDSSVFALSSDLFNFTAGVESIFSNRTAADTTPPTPNVENDGVFFNDTEVVSDGTTVKWKDAGTWTTIASTGLPSNGGTCMEVFAEKNSLLIGKGNEVAIVSTAWAVGTSLVLSADYEVTSIACAGATAYIATRHAGNGDAKMFLWDGAGADANASYSVGTYELSTIKEYQGSVVGVDALGRILRFNGGGFDLLAAFPVYYRNIDWGQSDNNNSVISNRGMYVDGDVLYFNINPRTEDSINYYLSNMPGGLWCYDPNVGLYHRGSQSKNTITNTSITESAVNTSTDQITVSSAPNTGTELFYGSNSGSITGLTENTWYYVIKIDSTHIQLAKSYADAIAGNEIDLTAVSTGTAQLYYVARSDWGDTYNSDLVATLALPNSLYTDSVERIIYSNTLLDKTDTDNFGITVSNKNLDARGYFITPKMFSPNIEDTYNKIILRYRPLKRGDEIRVKYRMEDKQSTNIPNDSVANRITWTSTTTFTTTIDWSEVEVGWEVEVFGGQGAGHIAHISAISYSTGTYTVTIDEACSVVANGDYARAIATNWTYLDTIDYTYERNWKDIAVDNNGSWIQFKIELRGRAVTIEEVIVTNTKAQ